ncbi:MAG: hypothetical protein AB9846_02010 [Tenuifilaceae bacterium]
MQLRILGNKLSLTIILLFLGFLGFAQEEEDEFWNKLLREEVEVAEPVYKPVISFGAGILNFMGDIKSPGSNLLSGKFGYKLNVSTLFGKKNYYRLNLFVMLGGLSGHDFNISRQMQLAALPLDITNEPIYPNTSFSTDIIQFGINAEYSFGHFFKSSKQFRPYFSVGIAPIQYSPKGNLKWGDGISDYYHHWSDGTIRDFSEDGANAFRARVLNFDNNYETDLSNINMYDIGDYTQTSVTVPIEVGLDFYLSERVNLRIASSFSFALTDLLDNYNEDVAKLYTAKSDGRRDMFSFTYFTMNFDLFSDPKTMMIEKMFADIDYDYLLLADEDNDNVFDVWDKCPDTPMGEVVDSTGCPFDGDNDGVFDYDDQEQDTPQGATVDDQGVQLSEDKLSEMFEQKNAVSRKEIRVVPVAPIWTRNITFTPGVIPQKFKIADIDGDGYISFAELLKTVDAYFDEKTDFKTEDIYELNEFFFSQ